MGEPLQNSCPSFSGSSAAPVSVGMLQGTLTTTNPAATQSPILQLSGSSGNGILTLKIEPNARFEFVPQQQQLPPIQISPDQPIIDWSAVKFQYSSESSGSENTTSGSIGAPGLIGSMVPFYGSGRSAINNFQTGHYWWGAFDVVMFVSDIFLIKSLLTAPAKGLIHVTGEKAIKEIAKKETLEGAHGIFATTESIASQGKYMRALRTTKTAGETKFLVEIPEAAVSQFRRPIAAGPFSAWHFQMGTHYAQPLIIDLKTGAVKAFEGGLRPEIQFYTKDVLLRGIQVAQPRISEFTEENK